MSDNLFDWEQPDDKIIIHIMEHGEKELAKTKSTCLYISVFLFIIFEYFPSLFSLIFYNEYIKGNGMGKEFITCIIAMFVVLICVITNYYFTVRSKYKLLSQIKNNKIKTMPAIVRDKKLMKKISVQLLGNETKFYTVPRSLHKKIQAGSSLIAIKYDNKYGFNDKYDFILDPNLIAEEEKKSDIKRRL